MLNVQETFSKKLRLNKELSGSSVSIAEIDQATKFFKGKFQGKARLSITNGQD